MKPQGPKKTVKGTQPGISAKKSRNTPMSKKSVKKTALVKHLPNKRGKKVAQHLTFRSPSHILTQQSQAPLLPNPRGSGGPWVIGPSSSSTNSSANHSTARGQGHSRFTPSMSLDRSMRRGSSSWDHQAGHMFSQDYYPGDSYGSGRQGSQYIDFDQDWPNPWGGPPPYPDQSHDRWQNGPRDWQQGGGDWPGEGPVGGRPGGLGGRAMPEDCSHRKWDTWRSGKPKPVRTHPPGNRKAKQRASQMGWVRESGSTAQSDGGVGGSGSRNERWNHFTKQFGISHFHREHVDSAEGEFSESGSSVRAAQSDGLGLDDSGSSGGGIKRPRSLDREGQLSKSSRAESSTKQSGFLNPNSSRALSLSDLNGGKAPKPDSTSRQEKVKKGPARLPGDSARKTSAGLSIKVAIPAGKKKQVALKPRAAAAGPGSKVADRQGKAGEQEGEGSGEGVLERAERMCQELREKRQQAAHLRSASSGQRVATLRNALNTSAHRFKSAHKSFMRGYLSDSGATPAVVTDGCGTPASVAPKKHFSSSCEPPVVARTRPKAASAAASLQSSQTSEVGSSSVSPSSSQLSDIERIRHSIESSVMAEGRTGKQTTREGSLLGNYSPAASVSSSATRASSTATGPAGASLVGSKPPLPLSKDALAKMVNTPRSRTQRVQLARMLRQHTATAMTRPRRIQLDGLYDNEDGDSIQDVLKNISGLDEIGDCAELKNIKLEDLTSEDKLRIAQLIEEVDTTERDYQPSSSEYGAHVVAQRGPPPFSDSSRGNCAEPSDREAEMSDQTQSDRPRSPLRLQAASPMPSKPLSLDDLHTEGSQQETQAVCSPPVVTSALMHSPPARSSPLHCHVQFPTRPTSVCSPSSSRTAAAVRDGDEMSVDNSDTPLEPVHTTTSQPSGRTSPEFRSGRGAEHGLCSPPQRSPVVPMEVSDGPDPGNSSVAGGILPSRSTGVLHEVMMLCREQDAVVAEMRDIDVELSQMYKSLIEIVARMSGLQRRRVQLQSEGEQLSQRRNHLLSGLVPKASIPLGSRSRFTREERQPSASPSSSAPATQTAVAEEGIQVMGGTMEPLPGGTSITLPSWLAAPSPSPSSSSQLAAERSESRQRGTVTTPSIVDQLSDVCLSGSVTSSLGSTTPLAMSGNALLGGSMDSVREVGDVQDKSIRPSSSNLSSRPSSAGSRAGRDMLSISGMMERDKKGDDESELDLTPTSALSLSAETVSQPGAKSSLGADSSSGIGSSVSTHASGGQKSGLPASEDHSQQCSPLTKSSLSSSLGQQPGHSPAAGPGQRLVFNTLGSPPSTSSGGPDVPKSPGISVAYLGALSSDLVQQIVRSLPLTSQLGEMGAPSMYMLKQGTPGPGGSSSGNQPADAGASVRSRASAIDTHEVKSRRRTSSVLSASSLASDLSSGEQTLSASIPPLKLSGGSERGGSKTCTPRSESDSHSVTSGTSLGEQIKLFSERNTSSQGTASSLSSLSYTGANTEDGKESMGISIMGMPRCSVVLDRLDLEDGVQQVWKMEEDETDRPKKRKTKKDRNQSLQRRRRYIFDSSSEGEEDEGEAAAAGEDGLLGAVSVSGHQQRVSSMLLDGVELMEADCKSEEEDLDTTLVGSGRRLSQEAVSEEEVSSSQASSSLAISPSQLRLNPENLKAFRANVRRNLTTPAAADSSAENAQKGHPADSAMAKRDQLKICGPCAPVMGLHVHGSLLYVCFQGIGVNSYTMEGQLAGEYPMPSAQCFTITPTGSGSQHLVAVGAEDRLTFLSTSDQSVVSSLDSVLKVMCMLMVDTSLFVGLGCGAVVVVSLTTLQETRRFQASDMAIHCMAWTREGSTRLLCVAAQDAHIHVIDSASGLPVRIIGGHTKTAFSLCMVDHFVLSGSGDRKVMAHNVHTAVQDWELNDHKGIITSICVDSGLLFSAGYDKIIRCYDLKSRKLLHLIYGAGKSIVMKMIIHGSMLYTGNRDGQVEALDLREMGSFTCECVSCSMVYGLKEHLWHHLVADHLLPNAQAMQCPWSNCSIMLNTGSALVKAGEHMRNHINCS